MNPVKGCLGKKRYSKALAKETAACRTKGIHTLFNAYHCTNCDAWHIGHIPYYERQKLTINRVDAEIEKFVIKNAPTPSNKRTKKRNATRKRQKLRRMLKRAVSGVPINISEQGKT